MTRIRSIEILEKKRSKNRKRSENRNFEKKKRKKIWIENNIERMKKQDENFLGLKKFQIRSLGKNLRKLKKL